MLNRFVVAVACLALPTFSYASPGQTIPCTEKLSELKAQNTRDYPNACRESGNGAVSMYDSKNNVLRIDTGTELKEKPFAREQAESLLDTFSEGAIKEVSFNSETLQWVVYDDTQAQASLQQIYLLPENFKNRDRIITLSAPAVRGYRLIDGLEFSGRNLIVHDAHGKSISVKNEVPTYEQMRKSAYEFYDVRDIRLNFMTDGLKGFPSYDKVKAIVEKCDAVGKSGKRARCFAKEEKNLAKEILLSTRVNDPSNTDLIKFLSDRRLRTTVTGGLIHQYRLLATSQTLNENYDWSKEGMLVGEGGFFFHYTYDLGRGVALYSPGMFWWKPIGFSIRYAYYPIALISP